MLLAFVPLLLAGYGIFGAAPVATAGAPGAVAVVELFTSEGCSSCPPADALLREIGRSAAAVGAPVHCLSFHVDYWNGLGWPDPFSSEAATRRQRRYSPDGRVYTPQMVVNGKAAFVGSNASSARSALADALGRAAPHQVRIEGVAVKAGVAAVRFRVQPAPPPGSTVLVALTEDGLEVDVPRGENAGETLRHDHVVRAFQIIPGAEAGAAELPVPNDLRPADAHVIVIAEAKGGTLGAAARRL